MLESLKVWFPQVNRDWWSKLTDGLLSGGLLLLLWLTVALATRSIAVIFGQPGLLVYVLCLLAISMALLQQSIVSRRSETSRSWYGICSGFLAWSVAGVNDYLGVPILPNLAGVILLIMVTLIVGLLWRSVLPLGVRFFSLAFLLNWVERIIASLEGRLAAYSPIFLLGLRALGIFAAFAALLVVGWMLFRTRRRLQRISGALMLWFLVSLVIYIFGGAFF